MNEPEGVRLFLVRHGQAASNRELRYLGRSDEPLTSWGREQAEALGIRLRQCSLDGVLSSPLVRARETADAIVGPGPLRVEVDDDLAELCFGEWEGLTRAELAAGDADSVRRLKAWETDPSVAPPGGESRDDLNRRVERVLDDVSQRFRGGSVALVSHVGPIKAVLDRVFGVDRPLPMFLDPGTVTVVDWGRRPMLRLFNAHGHFGWERARWMASGREV